MGDREYVSELGGRSQPFQGGHGGSHNQWDDDNPIPTQHPHQELNSMPRTSYPQGYHLPNPNYPRGHGFREPWGFEKGIQQLSLAEIKSYAPEETNNLGRTPMSNVPPREQPLAHDRGVGQQQHQQENYVRGGRGAASHRGPDIHPNSTPGRSSHPAGNHASPRRGTSTSVGSDRHARCVDKHGNYVPLPQGTPGGHRPSGAQTIPEGMADGVANLSGKISKPTNPGNGEHGRVVPMVSIPEGPASSDRSQETGGNHRPAGPYPASAGQAPRVATTQNLTKASGNGGELLDPRYQQRRDRKEFFQVGRVFSVVHHESAGNETTKGTQGSSQFSWARYGTRVFTQIRRMVVVKVWDNECWCLTIRTYRQQGTRKQGFDPKIHTAIHMKGQKPMDPGPRRMPKEPLEVIPCDPTQKLDPESLINFSKLHTVEYYQKVMEVGKVSERCMTRLQVYWEQHAKT